MSSQLRPMLESKVRHFGHARREGPVKRSSLILEPKQPMYVSGYLPGLMNGRSDPRQDRYTKTSDCFLVLTDEKTTGEVLYDPRLDDVNYIVWLRNNRPIFLRYTGMDHKDFYVAVCEVAA